MISTVLNLKTHLNNIELKCIIENEFPITLNNTLVFSPENYFIFNSKLIEMLKNISINFEDFKNGESVFFDIIADKGFGFIYFSYNTGFIIHALRYKGAVPSIKYFNFSSSSELNSLIDDLIKFENLFSKVNSCYV